MHIRHYGIIMHTTQIFNPLAEQKSLRGKGLQGSGVFGYGGFITYPREVRITILCYAIIAVQNKI